MNKLLKNLVVVIGVFVISSGIFFLMYENQAVKEEVFGRSLQLLGEQLLSMVPEGEGKAAVAEKWQKFTSIAEKGEVPPERIERVAIGILNASNLDTVLSTEEAEDILALAFVDPSELLDRSVNHEIDLMEKIPESSGSTVKSIPTKMSEPSKVLRTHSKRIIEKELQELGKNLQAVCEFNKNIRTSCNTDPEKRESFVKNFRYEINNGIRLNADLDFREKLKSIEYRPWATELELLDKRDIVEWRHNFALEIDKEVKNIKLQLDSLSIIIDSFNNNNTDAILEYKGSLENLKSLQHLQYWNAIDPEEVKRIVYENLQEAGVNMNKN